MSRKTAKVNQVDVERAIRAMKNNGFKDICAIVKQDGVYIQIRQDNPHNSQDVPLAPEVEIRL